LTGIELSLRGVLFDFGNTLIPFGRREMDAVNEALVSFVVAEAPGADAAVARRALRETLLELNRGRVATNRESDPRDAIRRTLAALGVSAVEEDHVVRGFEAYRRAFLAAVTPGPGMRETLRAVRDSGRRAGLLSNYSHAPAIHDAVAAPGIRDLLDVVVVSGDVGVVKPDPEIFLLAASRLGLEPGEILFVGDNSRADIAGAAAVGMRTAWVTEHLGGRYVFEDPDENEADVEPDITLSRLIDLREHPHA
jgi:HAD superfamily hydrolase (TIGR01509 family)